MDQTAAYEGCQVNIIIALILIHIYINMSWKSKLRKLYKVKLFSTVLTCTYYFKNILRKLWSIYKAPKNTVVPMGTIVLLLVIKLS